MEKPNLGGDEIKAKFQQKLENAIDERFDVLKQENARKRNEFIVSKTFGKHLEMLERNRGKNQN